MPDDYLGWNHLSSLSSRATVSPAVDGGLSVQEWNMTCIRLAPNSPEQNPVEDVWLQAEQFIRKYARFCKKFEAVKFLFQLVTHCQIFAFPKVFMYGYCSSPLRRL